MPACEWCWAEANRRALLLGGAVPDRYREVLAEQAAMGTSARCPTARAALRPAAGEAQEREGEGRSVSKETCPRCEGEKVLRGFACPGFRPIELPCYVCKGIGTVDDLARIWIEDGAHLKTFREARDFSLREAATWLGCSPVDWSDAEHGRVDPSPLRARVHTKAMAAFRR